MDTASSSPATDTTRVAPPPAGRALDGHTIVVTGGSRGLGAAIAQVLGAEGASVVLADVALERAQAFADSLGVQGVKASAIALDVGDERQVERALAQVREQFGRLDAVINNAAIDVTLSIGELSGGEWERIVRTNLTGPFFVAKYAAEAMALHADGRRGGHIVNITSTAAKRAWPNAAAYHATKWGLLGLSHALHAELRPQGIKVSAVVVGGMRTPFLLDRFPDIDQGVLQDPMNVAQAVRFVLTQPEETVIPEVMVLPMRETSWP